MHDRQADLWELAASGTDLLPLDCKAIFVAGLVRHHVESAGCCFAGKLHIAAHQLAVSPFETLAEVVTGSREMSYSQRLATGLRYALGHPIDPDDRELTVAVTSTATYDIRDCINRRGYTAHGAIEFRRPIALDSELTAALLELALAGLDRWWASLRESKGLTALAQSKVTPVFAGTSVVFVHDLVEALSDENTSPGGSVMWEASWR
jgi:hypothetical protein